MPLISSHRNKGLRQITDVLKQTNVLCSSPHPFCRCSPKGSPQLVQDRNHQKQWLESSSWTSDTSLIVQFLLGEELTSDVSIPVLPHSAQEQMLLPFGLELPREDITPLLAMLLYLWTYTLVAHRIAPKTPDNIPIPWLLTFLHDLPPQ